MGRPASPFTRETTMKPIFLRATPAALCAALAPALHAQEHTNEPARLGTIVLTATGREQSLADVPASVQVIDSTDLQNSSGLSMGQALGQATGLLVRNTGAGASTSIRGQKTSGTLVLIDGQSRTGKYGGFNLNNFAVGEVERIEIVRGPMSALYGADALGGVINVITKRPGTAPGAAVSLMTGARTKDGERLTFGLGASVETGDERFGQRFAIDLQSTDGYALAGTVRGQDFSDLQRVALSWSGAWVPNEGQELRWRLEAYRQKDKRDSVTSGPIPAPYGSREEEDRISLDASWTQDLGAGQLILSGLLSYSDGETNRAYPGPDETTEYVKARVQARYDLSLADHDLSFAAGVQHDDIKISSYTKNVGEYQYFALIQDDWRISDRVALTIGARVDHFENFDTTFNPRIVLGSRGDGVTWRIGAGRAFRAPGLGERYTNIRRGSSWIIGNPDLDPETAISYEAAIGWRDDRRAIELVWHDSQIEDLITTVRNGAGDYNYTNVNKARIKGVELTGSWQATDSLHLSGGLEYLDARDDTTDLRLTSRYRTAWHLASTWDVTDAWRLSGRLRGMDGFLDSNSARRTYTSGFTIVDISAAYAITPESEISFGIDNVFERSLPDNYSTARFREDGSRFAWIKLNRRF